VEGCEYCEGVGRVFLKTEDYIKRLVWDLWKKYYEE
jgi:hypothetical protein